MTTVTHVEPKQRAVFLDRDGTLNEDPGYIDRPEQIRLFPDAAEAVRLLNSSGRKVVIVTNQSGVARGLLKESSLRGIHSHLLGLLEAGGARIDALYYCPHYPPGANRERAGDSQYRRECDCRKPKPGMLLQAARDLNIDLSESVVIGDRYLDVKMAHSVGARGVLVLTGEGQAELDLGWSTWPKMPELIVPDLRAAVDALLEMPD